MRGVDIGVLLRRKIWMTFVIVTKFIVFGEKTIFNYFKTPEVLILQVALVLSYLFQGIMTHFIMEELEK